MSKSPFERIPPHSLEAERAVLGACLLDRDSLLLVTETLAGEDFYDTRHRLAFEVVLDMARKDKPVDPLTIWEEISRREMADRLGGQGFIAGLVDTVPTIANVEYHAHIVRDKSVHRRLVQVGSDIVKLGYAEDREMEDILDEAERSVFEIARRGGEKSFRHIGDILGITFQQIETHFQQQESVTGVSSGFLDFDRITAGFQPGSLNIIAARPSMGKTALALNIAQFAALEKKRPVLVFSLEMGGEQLAQRMLASEARVNVHDLRTGTFHESAWEALADAAGRLSQAPIYIDDSSVLSTLELRARCRRFKARKSDVGMIVVDYLQLMHLSRPTDSKQQEVAEISRSLKGIARELDVPIIALSQLSRAVEQRQDKRPQLSDLRDSGAIEQDADLVVLLFRPGYYSTNPEEEDNVAEAIIAKHRNGPTGTVPLIFIREYTRFVNAERYRPAQSGIYKGAMPTVMRKKRVHNPEAQSGTSREPVNGLREEIVSLIPEWLFYPLICISLVVPNLVFSPGATFFQSLHILKWTTALVPIGILSAVTGVMIVAGSQKRKDFLVDPLGWMWLFLLLYITAQPAWLSLSSIPTFVREWMFFASLFITMLLCVNFFRRRDMFMLVLFGAGLNAAVNVLFAELQVRMSKLPAFVLPVPGNYVGNTGQQNMLGIWVAMALLSGLVLHLMLMEERRESRAGAAFPALIGLNMVLLGVNAWGLFSTTSRQSLLAFAAGIFILLLMGSWLRGKSFIKALVPVLLIILLAMGAAYQFNTVRTQVFVEKAESLAKGAVGEKSELSEADSGRLSIYATAWTMLKKHPFLGVGIGHFKWNYLDAQRDLFRRYPDSKLKWQYTMWAHSELFHWFCEMGFIGGIFLLGILGWCAWCIVKTMIAKKRVSLEGLWAVALLTLIWTVALWGERPFHRIEDALWLSLAFAFLGREFLPEKFSWTEINRPLIWKGFGLVVASTAMAGLVFLGNGLRADHALAQAMRSRDSQFQESMLEKAARSLMVRDLSDRAHAEHYLALATARKDGRALAEGLARLEAYFMRQPQTRELNALISWYGRLGNREKLEIFTSYLKPGSYSIKPAGIPSSGK